MMSRADSKARRQESKGKGQSARCSRGEADGVLFWGRAGHKAREVGEESSLAGYRLWASWCPTPWC